MKRIWAVIAAAIIAAWLVWPRPQPDSSRLPRAPLMLYSLVG
jgi:hypothetical protein